jgi:hypothetical protein
MPDIVSDIEEAVLSLSEGDYAWNASIILTDLSFYQILKRGDVVELNVQGEIYTLIVESKSLNRDRPAGVAMRIEALSPSIYFSPPYCDLIDYENTTPVTAREAVEAILGASVTWNTIDWPIPAGRIVAEQAVPIELAQQIVEVVGAVIEPDKSGALIVRDAYPVNLPDYDTAVPDHVYTDIEHNLSVSETFEPRDDYNKFRILEGEAGYTDTLEWVPNDDIATGGILRAYPTPWRTSIRVVHTDGASVSLSLLGTRTRQETQIVEFVAGSGTLSYPAISIDSVVWYSSPLPGLALESHTATITAGTTVNQGYGVAEITYTVETIDYESNAPLGSVVQYLIEDLS